MTGREWQPGDMAVVTGYGYNTRAVFSSGGCANPVHGRLDHWCYLQRTPDGASFTSNVGAEARLLVVIDPESAEDTERLAAAWDAITDSGPLPNERMTVRALRTRAALREFVTPTPTKPDEPSKWGVVEASCVHSPRRLHWMRHADDNWWPFAPYGEDDRRPLPDDWDSLVDPVVVRDGVAGEPS